MSTLITNTGLPVCPLQCVTSRFLSQLEGVTSLSAQSNAENREKYQRVSITVLLHHCGAGTVVFRDMHLSGCRLGASSRISLRTVGQGLLQKHSVFKAVGGILSDEQPCERNSNNGSILINNGCGLRNRSEARHLR